MGAGGPQPGLGERGQSRFLRYVATCGLENNSEPRCLHPPEEMSRDSVNLKDSDAGAIWVTRVAAPSVWTVSCSQGSSPSGPVTTLPCALELPLVHLILILF